MSSDAEDRWTVKRLLTWTADFLKKKGSESPRLDAEVLLAHVLEWPRVQLYTHFEQEVEEAPRSSFRELVKRRSEGAPVAYLVGRKEFFSLSLIVSPAVLIPRPDTETAVVVALDCLKGKPAPRVVDVGTGSGCLALAIAKHHPTAQVLAIDLSEDALAVARKNAEILGLLDRIEFRRGDLLATAAQDGPFDMIVSNPPYIASGEIAKLERGVRDFEPHLALDGGPDGLRVVDRLIEQARTMLSLGGDLILEIGSEQEMPVRALIASREGFAPSATIRDAANYPRVIAARWAGGELHA
jgi:release factor glutamine methyltransferase